MNPILQAIVWLLEVLFFFGIVGSFIVILFTIFEDFKYLWLSDEKLEADKQAELAARGHTEIPAAK